jgi:hypothetical protein
VNISVVPVDPTVPTVPSSLVGSVLNGMQISLSWPASTDAAGVTGYQVERCQGVGCTNFALIASPTTTSFVDTSLTPGVSYSYRVRARDTSGIFSPYSPIMTETPTNRRTLASDTFIRANENPLSGGGTWASGYGGGFVNCKLASNAVANTVVGGADCLAAYSAGSWPNDQWSQMTIGTFSGTLNEEVAVRVQPTPAGSYYACMIRRGSSFTSGIRIYTNGGSGATLGSSAAETWQPGDVALCQVQNDSSGHPVISLFKNGTLVSSYTDTSNTYTSGLPGFAIQSATQTFGAWSGGDFAAP